MLLAEADVPYSIVKDMTEVNKDMSEYDLVLVVGANDTVNPASLEPGSKIYGMPVIEVWRAKHTVVLKRSLAPGYAAIENFLFYLDSTRMLFGNAKDTTAAIFACLSQVSQLLNETPRRVRCDVPRRELLLLASPKPSPIWRRESASWSGRVSKLPVQLGQPLEGPLVS